MIGRVDGMPFYECGALSSGMCLLGKILVGLMDIRVSNTDCVFKELFVPFIFQNNNLIT